MSELKEYHQERVRLTVLHWLAKRELSEIEDVGAEAESTARGNEADLHRRWAEAQAGLSDEDKREYEDVLSDEAYRLTHLFPQTVRRSLLVMTYGVVEQYLDRMCRELKTVYELALSKNDLRDRGIERSRTYIKRVAQLSFPDETQEWSDVVDLGLLRNHLMHVGPTLWKDEQSSQDVIKRFERWPEVTAELGQRVDLHDQFLGRALRASKGLCAAVNGVFR